METETILYSDDHHVKVTNTYFKVNKSQYPLTEITNHGFLIIRPERLPSLVVIVLGVALLFSGFLNLLPESFSFKMFSMEISSSAAASGFGVTLLVVGAVALIFMRVRYAIRIATAKGETNVIVSGKKEYVNLILDALNRAFIGRVAPSTEMKKPRFETK
jgi:hypothetical protein